MCTVPVDPGSASHPTFRRYQPPSASSGRYGRHGPRVFDGAVGGSGRAGRRSNGPSGHDERRDEPCPDEAHPTSCYSAISLILTIFSAEWFASVPWIWSSSSRRLLGLGLGALVGGGDAGLDALGHDRLGLVDERLDHLVLGHDPDDLALHEQVPAPASGGDAEVGLPRLARAVHDATHHRDLQRDLAIGERLLRVVRDLDHVDLGAPARRARDEVESLALAQAERLEQLTTGAAPPRPGRR